jgi:Rrf2 family protein
MLTKKTRYALKALIALAELAPGQSALIADIAAQEGLPKKFLEAILRELKQHGILQAQRGRGGGYALLKPSQDVTLVSIIRALDGPVAPVPCLSRTAYRRCDECKSERTCGVRSVLSDLHEATMRVLEGTTLADMVRRTHEVAAQEERVGRYAI